MKPRSSCSPSTSTSRALLVLLLCCSCSSVARSQTTADSCTASLAAAVSRLIPFDTSNLTCFDAWTSQGFIVRYGKQSRQSNNNKNDTWSFVLSAPDGGGYISVGFSSDGNMVGSSAVAGWTAGGVAVARYLRRHDPLWFYAHVSVQGVGFVLGAAGVVAGFRLGGGGGVPGADDRHRALGVAVLVLGCLQVLAFLARPGKEAKVRRYWNWYHRYVGRAAAACAVANVFVGLSVAREAAALSAFYGVFLAVSVLASVLLEVRLWRTASASR